MLYCYIIILTKRENRKIMVALLLATIMIMGGFMGLMYFNHENNTVDKTHIPELNYYLNKYDFKDFHNVCHTTVFNNANDVNAVTDVSNNTVLTMSYTFYNGTDNVSGELLHIYKNGQLFHESLLVNNTHGNNYNYSVIPLYSKSGNYNITILNHNVNKASVKGISSDVYIDLYATRSTGPSGWACAFSESNTEVLITYIGAIGALSGIGSMGALAAIAVIGAATIAFFDEEGGNNGVYFYEAHAWFVPYTWINAPASAVPNSYNEYGSHRVTLYEGNIA